MAADDDPRADLPDDVSVPADATVDNPDPIADAPGVDDDREPRLGREPVDTPSVSSHADHDVSLPDEPSDDTTADSDGMLDTPNTTTRGPSSSGAPLRLLLVLFLLGSTAAVIGGAAVVSAVII